MPKYTIRGSGQQISLDKSNFKTKGGEGKLVTFFNLMTYISLTKGYVCQRKFVTDVKMNSTNFQLLMERKDICTRDDIVLLVYL